MQVEAKRFGPMTVPDLVALTALIACIIGMMVVTVNRLPGQPGDPFAAVNAKWVEYSAKHCKVVGNGFVTGRRIMLSGHAIETVKYDCEGMSYEAIPHEAPSLFIREHELQGLINRPKETDDAAANL